MARSDYGPSPLMCPLLKVIDTLIWFHRLEKAAFNMRCQHAGLDPDLVEIRASKKEH